MSFVHHWYSGAPVSSDSAGPPNEFVTSMSTVDGLSYTPSEEDQSRNAAQIAATGRRTWKTIKGSGEAIWPPQLESALLKALYHYHVEHDTTLTRFARRNQYVSDFIFKETGKRRSAKQIGSRLQQLRDTCKGGKILQLISPRHRSDEPETQIPTSSRAQSEVRRSLSLTPSLDTANDLCQQNVVYVEIQLGTDLEHLPVIPFIANEITNPVQIKMDIRKFIKPDSISFSSTCPTLQFSSPCPLLSESTFSVFFEESYNTVHTETTSLRCRSSPANRSGWLYTAELPSFWGSICESKYRTRYTIVQAVIPERSQAQPLPEGVALSAVYHFCYIDNLVPEVQAGPSTQYSSLTASGDNMDPQQLDAAGRDVTLSSWHNGYQGVTDYEMPIYSGNAPQPHNLTYIIPEARPSFTHTGATGHPMQEQGSRTFQQYPPTHVTAEPLRPQLAAQIEHWPAMSQHPINYPSQGYRP